MLLYITLTKDGNISSPMNYTVLLENAIFSNKINRCSGIKKQKKCNGKI